MDVIVERQSALDVHKAQVTACVRVPGAAGRAGLSTLSEFKTTVRGLLVLRDWLKAHAVTHVVMEATGDYWKPVWHVLEDDFELMLVNARHVKQVPGRKTDVSDAAWLCQLAEAGLLGASFVPPKPIRDLRQLTRYRKAQIAERKREAQRLHKALEDTGIKLDCVATDILGKSGRAMLDALVAGTTDPDVLAELAREAACQAPRATRGAGGPLRALARAVDRRDPRAPGLPRRADRACSRARSRTRSALSGRRLSCCARPRRAAAHRRAADRRDRHRHDRLSERRTPGFLGLANAPATTSRPASAEPAGPEGLQAPQRRAQGRSRWRRSAPTTATSKRSTDASAPNSATPARWAPSSTR